MDLKLGLSLNMRHNLQWQLITGTSCGPQVVRETSVVLAVVQRGSSSGFVRAFKAFSLCSGKRKTLKTGLKTLLQQTTKRLKWARRTCQWKDTKGTVTQR
ncbi:hypothetical protein L798_02978 [Zootermopsis nevadensis]|uniref:Uncharacterized protein n=1 Tax=Zootermopsis nevadensis TaxID=136037 RepID=A0A067REP5_ZOONE|nr:hypothetical protein L798_02978 [Zootermopsis nevadensis]